jgi:hypothetical protein
VTVIEAPTMNVLREHWTMDAVAAISAAYLAERAAGSIAASHRTPLHTIA